jgi:hypothetical protein
MASVVSPVRSRPALAGAVALLSLVAGLPGHAVDSLQGRIETITGDDWKITGLSFSVRFDAPQLRGDVRIDALELPSAGLLFADVIVDCGHVELSAAEFGCLSAQFTVDVPRVGRETFPGEAIYERETGTTRFALEDISIADGHASLRGSATETSVDIEISGNGLELAGLAGIAQHFSSEPPGFSATGKGSLTGSFRLRDGRLSHVSLTTELTDASMSNEDGTLVTDAMHALVDLDADSDGGRWQFEIDVTANAGEAYVEPVYTNLRENAVTFGAEGWIADELTAFDLTAFTLTQGSEVDVAGNLRASMGAGDKRASFSGKIDLRDSSVDAIYSGLFQVLLAGTVVGDLQTTGTVAGTVSFEDSTFSEIDLRLRELNLEDEKGRFAAYGLNGSIHWRGPEGDVRNAVRSRLSWDGGSAYDIPLGSSTLEARVGGNDFHLSEPLRVPTMGGAFLLKQLELNDFGTDSASGLLDAELEPIELGQLTSAFGWPAFSGSLSGQLPLLQYDAGVVTVGGSLTASAFDGHIEFANLRLEEPLGLAPRLYGDLRLRRLDLEKLTDTFSFGLIQGRLSGDVSALEMIAWRPVAMDLHLYTPPRDPARRRISQRAVENLASVGGGGAAAALSTGFMKFFEEFSYKSIGIRCILKDETCRMSGVGPAGDGPFGRGYYIVKGSGLPRIDVVGYRHQVSWNTLIRQLDSIAASGGPVVN